MMIRLGLGLRGWPSGWFICDRQYEKGEDEMKLDVAKEILIQTQVHFSTLSSHFRLVGKKYDIRIARSSTTNWASVEKKIKHNSDRIQTIRSRNEHKRPLDTDPSIISDESGRMALYTTELVNNKGSSAHLCSVGNPVMHYFCVADYVVMRGIDPQYINDMWQWKGISGIVIDPWMNIACGFVDYPSLAKSKFIKWRRQGMSIEKGRSGDRPVFINPIDSWIDEQFLRAKLRFERVQRVDAGVRTG